MKVPAKIKIMSLNLWAVKSRLPQISQGRLLGSPVRKVHQLFTFRSSSASIWHRLSSRFLSSAYRGRSKAPRTPGSRMGRSIKVRFQSFFLLAIFPVSFSFFCFVFSCSFFSFLFCVYFQSSFFPDSLFILSFLFYLISKTNVHVPKHNFTLSIQF